MIQITLSPPFDTDELNAIAVMIAALGGRAGETVDALFEAHHGEPIDTWADDDMDTPLPASQAIEVALAHADIPMPPAPDAAAPPTVTVPPPPVGGVTPGGDARQLGVTLDSEGLPWDARIHAETKRTTAKGAWARRRNTTDELWDSVRAQLKATMAATGEPAPEPVGAPLSPDTISAAEAFTTATLVPPVPIPAPPVAAVPPPPPAAPAPGEDDFTRVLSKVVAMQTAKTITPEQVNAICAQLGLPEGVRSLMSRPDLLPSFETMLGV